MPSKYSDSRIKFPKGEQRKFLESALQKSNLDSIKFSRLVNVSPRTIRDWKREKYNITENAVKILCNKHDIILPNNLEQLKINWQNLRSETCRIGAKARYKIYGNFSTPEGRRKGGHNALQILRKRGLAAWCSKPYLYPKKSIRLAEFVGIMLGDGGITKEQATVTLNTVADKKYIKYVANLGKTLFGQKPKIAPRKDCKATNLRYSGINLINYLLKIGLKKGDKVKQQVSVPMWIMGSIEYKIACLRGLMDTDGCISRCTHKYKSKSYTYLNPCFANRSKPLLNFVTKTLDELNLHPSVAGERIWLYNKASVIDYFNIVGSSNFRLLRYKEDIPNGSGKSLLNFDA
ncbi:MAG: hypothetical protein UR39_C0005G0008 [Candidatus Woesebacteria bacterium GW2011_GWA1_33_30]|uniref:DOD-type homing endonuclease domain-containing protein n=1 Tax=Candidatus Woesebacteria bacterium GW2011_GWA2_33_28 TaxID=1618561 RepID=A0A0G0C7J9_9BACT|nr:MAG: hypothetical protein UR38_C0005G0008 [Candidatus Woesebacteria bacterium GW2011_GWA2_33_28]KKP48126.1 MAG: hypothetical protein UR39_C0005G0008 [Candidatus Woesebacteria bacterium GW2011_GWA1_33_30]KKP49368.1 MAG: hypothetical protein UR40_C0006G0008 [Microgenomates group bacterium GW2011_GWC1_33_32]KKP52094.1 MAG: hypothetical protein UR44_C0004G0008 [Candidatus Woesebacteria bacterium GW2011_GWB1_33_38]